jgi:hypothetical protein
VLTPMTTAFIRGILFISFEFRPLNLIRMRVVEIFILIAAKITDYDFSAL